ncbi:hypothetical protein AWH63_10755 [Marinobacter sp. C18]|uniref:restriction endonuclease n=1 Tax=Marinobacter sp. C18 TaxID=1772288 RepID=UPI000948AE5A|nr:restriction endonuclease [Marinobacter sp. C18]OLF82010.1 hypothetical protein AWH63_10755 [Marinobacter sp. C18]
MLDQLTDHISATGSALWSVFTTELSLGPLTQPLWLTAIQGAGLIAVLLVLTNKGRQSWRVAASRRWLKRFRANAHRYNDAQRLAYIRKTDHFLFEDILMSVFEQRGYRVQRTPATGDGGSDGYVKFGKLNVVVQAKRYSGPIARTHVLALERLARTKRGQDAGLFIHTGSTSKPIKQYVDNAQSLDMISGSSELLRFIDGDPMQVLGRPLNPIKKA